MLASLAMVARPVYRGNGLKAAESVRGGVTAQDTLSLGIFLTLVQPFAFLYLESRCVKLALSLAAVRANCR